MRHWLLLARAAGSIGMLAPLAAHSEPSVRALAAGFVYLRAVDPNIRQDMRYASANNFTGGVVDGYEAAECVLTKVTAEALARAQKRLAARHPGHVLKVYDCYRPVRAVRRFAAWSREPKGRNATAFHHPEIPRRRLFALGYIAAQSGHSRGNAIDLTIERIATAPEAPAVAPTSSEVLQPRAAACTAPEANREADSGLDMGTAYDCFDPKSHTRSGAIGAEQRRARAMLLDVMSGAGFENFSKEWWHFSHPAGASRNAQDFVVRAMPAP